LSSLSICIDGFNLALPKGTGVATYARNLAAAYSGLGYKVDILYGLDVPQNAPKALQEVLFFDKLGGAKAGKAARFPTPKWFKKHFSRKANAAYTIDFSGRVELRNAGGKIPPHNIILNCNDLFERAAKYYKRTKKFLVIDLPNPPQIMHWTYPLPIRVRGAVNVYTLHDLVPLTLPQTTLDNKTYYYRLIRSICRSGDKIITVSEASKRDIISFFPASRSNVYNTYQTAELPPVLDDTQTYEEKREIKSLFGLDPDEYFIFFGSLEPKKNIGRLIEAFLASGVKRRLVIVGAMAWKTEEELRFLKRGVEQGRILHLDYLPRFSLVALLRNARALLFPSIAEGFGLPALEAFSVGTPVLCSVEGGLGEVAGDAAYIVDAYDIQSIMRGINAMDRDDDLCKRLRKAGSERFSQFSGDVYCKRLEHVCKSLLNK